MEIRQWNLSNELATNPMVNSIGLDFATRKITFEPTIAQHRQPWKIFTATINRSVEN